jgi:tetratricopeptide (TPR) repeat protein
MLNYAQKAVSLDPMDADAHAALGYALTLTGDWKQGEAHLDEALRLTPNAFDILIFHACLKHAYGKADKGAEASDRALAINPAYPNWAIPCMRLGVVLVGRYEDAIRIQSRQPESEMNLDGFVVLAGSLASLDRTEEAKGVVARGLAKFPGLLSIERFALNRYWAPGTAKVIEQLMRRAGFPACATSQELADTPNPVRLPECGQS